MEYVKQHNISFKIDMKGHKFEVSDCGHIWLSEADQKASYLCMCSMRKAVEAMGGKWMRIQWELDDEHRKRFGWENNN